MPGTAAGGLEMRSIATWWVLIAVAFLDLELAPKQCCPTFPERHPNARWSQGKAYWPKMIRSYWVSYSTVSHVQGWRNRSLLHRPGHKLCIETQLWDQVSSNYSCLAWHSGHRTKMSVLLVTPTITSCITFPRQQLHDGGHLRLLVPSIQLVCHLPGVTAAGPNSLRGPTAGQCGSGRLPDYMPGRSWKLSNVPWEKHFCYDRSDLWCSFAAGVMASCFILELPGVAWNCSPLKKYTFNSKTIKNPISKRHKGSFLWPDCLGKSSQTVPSV